MEVLNPILINPIDNELREKQQARAALEDKIAVSRELDSKRRAVDEFERDITEFDSNPAFLAVAHQCEL